jgi:hypothetical protein
MATQLSYEQIRSLVIDVLSPDFVGQINDLVRAVDQLARKRGLMDDPSAQQNTGGFGGTRLIARYDPSAGRENVAQVQSILWDLIIEGIIRPGRNDGLNNDLPFFHVSEFGKNVLSNGPQSPYDPDGYLKRLQNDIPALDPVIITYLNEALHTFRIGCLLSSTVTLGCASEKAFLLLVDAYATALPATQQDKFRKETENRMIKRQFEEFNKRLESHLKAKLTGDVKDDLEVTLMGVFAMMRNMRNDAGHPTGKTVPREAVYANLTVFPTYLRKIYSLINWLGTNPL